MAVDGFRLNAFCRNLDGLRFSVPLRHFGLGRFGLGRFGLGRLGSLRSLLRSLGDLRSLGRCLARRSCV